MNALVNLDIEVLRADNRGKSILTTLCEKPEINFYMLKNIKDKYFKNLTKSEQEQLLNRMGDFEKKKNNPVLFSGPSLFDTIQEKNEELLPKESELDTKQEKQIVELGVLQDQFLLDAPELDPQQLLLIGKSDSLVIKTFIDTQKCKRPHVYIEKLFDRIIAVEADCLAGKDDGRDTHIDQFTLLMESSAQNRAEESSLYANILKFMLERVGPSNELLLLDLNETFGSEQQRGENCKLAALTHAMQYAAYTANSPCLPLYKNRTKGQVSIRQLAKQYGSKIGEMYSIESLLSTCYAACYAATYSRHDHANDYIDMLKQYISLGFSPMIFFDVDMTASKRHGSPRIDGDGTNEHAATVVGYYVDTNIQPHFIVSHWNHFYDFIAEELAISTNRLQEKRAPESFLKVVDPEDQKTAWVLTRKIGLYKEILDNPERTASPLGEHDRPLKNSIMVVTGPRTDNRNLFFSETRLGDQIDTSPSLTASPMGSSTNNLWG